MKKIYQIKYRVVGYDYNGPHETEIKAIDFDQLEQLALKGNISMTEAVARIVSSKEIPKGYKIEIIDSKILN